MIRRAVRFQHPKATNMTLDVSIFGVGMDRSPTRHETPYVVISVLDSSGEVVESFHADEFAELIGDAVSVAEGMAKRLEKDERKLLQDA